MMIFFFQQVASPAQVAVELEKMNMIVVGFYNPVSVVVSDLPDSCLFLEPSAGKISRNGRGQYLWHITDTATLTLSLTDTCHHELIARRIYRTRKLPVHFLLGAKQRSETISAGEFKAQAGIAPVISGHDVCATCEMTGFTARFFSKKTGRVWTGHNPGARFKGEVLRSAQSVEPGDWVRFSGFSFTCPGMTMLTADDHDLYFRIK